MASEFWQKQRGEFSSFWDREVARPAKETYLKLLAWKNRAIGYLGLGEEAMASKPGIESRPASGNLARIPGTPEYSAARRAVLWLSAIGGLALVGGTAVEAWRRQTYLDTHGTLSGYNPFGENYPPTETQTASPVPSPTNTPSPTPRPTKTPRPPTATRTETRTPTGMERIKPTEKPLPGELFNLDCTEITWDECQQKISSLLMPLLETPWEETQSIIWDRENESVVFSPVPRASFKLQWKGLDGDKREKTGLVFDIKQGRRRIIQPVLSAYPLGQGEDVIGLIWYVGIVDENGVPNSLTPTLSTDLMNRLFVKQEKVHVINIIDGPVSGHKWKDAEATRLASKIGANESGVAPVRLVFGIGMEN